jgi:hypothetical protein
MPSGGARPNSGPPPDPQALRRDRPSDAATWIHLPAAGRQGDPPAFPLPRPTMREKAIWEREWRRPQAIEWERLGLHEEVAMYVRIFATAERSNDKGADKARGRLPYYQQDLGLNLGGLKLRRWIIDSAPEQRQATPPNDTDRQSAKARLRALQGGAT